jgi:palmitoyltransferase ZDHHC9/14/18
MQGKTVIPIVVQSLLWVLVNVCLLKVACSDPGFLPRLPPDEHILRHAHGFRNKFVRDGLQGQQTHLLQMKICGTCLIVRPKRAIHCSQCDACVEHMDHHCPFISTCVGRRNYPWFFAFICSLWVNSLFVLALTVADLKRRSPDSFREKMKKVPLSIPITLIGSVVLILIGLLIGFHFKMKARNETTFE